MIKKIIVVMFLLMPFPLKSENGIIIQVLYKENKNYRISMHINTDSKVDYRADENILSRIREKGVVNPMIIQQDQWMIMNTTTGAKGSKGRIPFSGKVDSSETIQYLNGKMQTLNNSSPLDTTFRMIGYYEGSKLLIDDISGQNINSSMKETQKNLIMQIVKSVKFPTKPLKIGETFSLTFPLSIPIKGFAEIQIDINTVYTLKNYDAQYAYFDVVQKFKLSNDKDIENVSLRGSGQGKMIYDRNENQIISTDTQNTTSMVIDTGSLVIVSNSNYHSEILNTITNRH
jgi:hypothetical protein